MMRSRKLPAVLTALTVSAGLWISGCGQTGEDAPEQPEQTIDADDQNDDQQDQQDEQPNSEEPAEAPPATLADDARWDGPHGPRGGTFANLWAADGAFFAAQVDARQNTTLWRSEDGDQWVGAQVPDGVEGHRIRTIIAHDDALFLLAPKLYRSTDDGQTWRQTEWQLSDGQPLEASAITIARTFGDELYVVSSPRQQNPRLYRISAGRAELVDDTLPARASDFVVNGQTLVVTQGDYAGRIFTKSADQTDWTTAEVPDTFAPGGVSLHLHDGVVYATSEAGVWRSAEGMTFTELSAESAADAVIMGDRLLFGPLAPWNYLMAIDLPAPADGRAGVDYLGGLNDAQSFSLATDGEFVVCSVRHNGLMRLDAESEDWEQVSPTLRPIVDFEPADPRLWAVSDGARLFNSAAGQTWTWTPTAEHRPEEILAHDDALYSITHAGEFVALSRLGEHWSLSEPVALSDGRPSAMLGYDDNIVVSFSPTHLSGGRSGSSSLGGGLFLAENRASHWTDWNKIDAGLPDDSAAEHTPPVYATYAEEGLLVAMAEDGLYRSVDRGESWQKARADEPVDTGYLSAAGTWILRAGGALFAANTTQSGVSLRRSDDMGETWTSVDHSLPEDASPTALSSDGPHLLVGTAQDGVLRSTDGGESWQPLGDDFPEVVVYDLEVRAATLWAATSGGIAKFE